MRLVTGPILKRYGAAFAACLVACLLTFSLLPVRGQSTFLLFLAAVAFSSWYGGIRSGVAATLLSATAGAFLFLPPYFSPLITDSSSLLRLIEFFSVAALIIALNAAHDSVREKAEAARREAESANRVKDDFLAAVTHELRTPLGVILGWVQMLRLQGFDAAAMDEALNRIERNALAQQQLIEDLLDVSRISRGSLRLEVRPLMPASVVGEVVASLRPAAEEKGVSLAAELDEIVGPVMADRGRLEQVAFNLITNAVKFTPRGGNIDVRVERDGADSCIVVSDTGIGIGAEFLPQVFERFRQERGAKQKATGGLGIGLAIVRQLVEMQGGTVTAHSPGEGLGATFIVRLPLIGVDDVKVETVKAAAAGTGEATRPAHLARAESDF